MKAKRGTLAELGRAVCVVLGCGLLWGLPLAAHAQSASDSKASTYRTHLSSALQLIENRQYERALEQLARAKRFAPSKAEDVSLLLYEGALLTELGKNEESTEAFRVALFLDPQAQLPLLHASPKVAWQFRDVRQQVLRSLGMPPASPRVTDVPYSSSSPSRALSPAMLGGVLLTAGAVTLVVDGQQPLSRDPGTYRAVGIVMVGMGILCFMGAGIILTEENSASAALGVSTDGTSAFVFGRWP